MLRALALGDGQGLKENTLMACHSKPINTGQGPKQRDLKAYQERKALNSRKRLFAKTTFPK